MCNVQRVGLQMAKSATTAHLALSASRALSRPVLPAWNQTALEAQPSAHTVKLGTLRPTTMLECVMFVPLVIIKMSFRRPVVRFAQADNSTCLQARQGVTHAKLVVSAQLRRSTNVVKAHSVSKEPPSALCARKEPTSLKKAKVHASPALRTPFKPKRARISVTTAPRASSALPAQTAPRLAHSARTLELWANVPPANAALTGAC